MPTLQLPASAGSPGPGPYLLQPEPPTRESLRLLILTLCSLAPSLILLYTCRGDWTVIGRYWDGPNYIEVAKTLYHVPVDHPFTWYKTTQAYFACHLPLYPLLIRLAAPVLGYPAAMIAVNWMSAVCATWAFYRVLQEYRCVSSPLFSAALSTVIPARWVIYKSVGATEPLFMLLACLTLLAYKRDRIALALLYAGLSTITRITGILFVIFFMVELVRTRRLRWLPIVPLVLLPLLLTFAFYRHQYGDFWAYFSWNAGLIHLAPMDIFRGMVDGGDTLGSELYLVMYVVYGLGTLLLWPYPPLFFYAGLFYGFTLFVFHEDVSRYMLACAPFALLVGYDRILNTTAFKLMLPMVIYLCLSYAAGLLPHNVVDMDAWHKLIAQPTYPAR